MSRDNMREDNSHSEYQFEPDYNPASIGFAPDDVPDFYDYVDTIDHGGSAKRIWPRTYYDREHKHKCCSWITRLVLDVQMDGVESARPDQWIGRIASGAADRVMSACDASLPHYWFNGELAVIDAEITDEAMAAATITMSYQAWPDKGVTTTKRRPRTMCNMSVAVTIRWYFALPTDTTDRPSGYAAKRALGSMIRMRTVLEPFRYANR